jgi:hypothetical protein
MFHQIEHTLLARYENHQRQEKANQAGQSLYSDRTAWVSEDVGNKKSSPNRIPDKAMVLREHFIPSVLGKQRGDRKGYERRPQHENR